MVVGSNRYGISVSNVKEILTKDRVAAAGSRVLVLSGR
jgi:chemotaxis signal transduction protein